MMRGFGTEMRVVDCNVFPEAKLVGLLSLETFNGSYHGLSYNYKQKCIL